MIHSFPTRRSSDLVQTVGPFALRRQLEDLAFAAGYLIVRDTKVELLLKLRVIFHHLDDVAEEGVISLLGRGRRDRDFLAQPGRAAQLVESGARCPKGLGVLSRNQLKCRFHQSRAVQSTAEALAGGLDQYLERHQAERKS